MGRSKSEKEDAASLVEWIADTKKKERKEMRGGKRLPVCFERPRSSCGVCGPFERNVSACRNGRAGNFDTAISLESVVCH